MNVFGLASMIEVSNRHLTTGWCLQKNSQSTIPAQTRTKTFLQGEFEIRRDGSKWASPIEGPRTRTCVDSDRSLWCHWYPSWNERVDSDWQDEPNDCGSDWTVKRKFQGVSMQMNRRYLRLCCSAALLHPLSLNDIYSERQQHSDEHLSVTWLPSVSRSSLISQSERKNYLVEIQWDTDEIELI